MSFSSPKERKMFGVDKEGFRARQARALQWRMADMGITAKMLAHAIDKHPDTVQGWAAGIYTMCGASVEAVDRYFQSRGDWTFFEEIYGDLGARRMRQAEQLERQAQRLRATAAALGAAMPKVREQFSLPRLRAVA